MPSADRGVAADVAANLDAIRRRIARAAERARRSADEIRLVAVSKTFGPDLVRAAAAAGQRVFGENRVQEALEKIDAVRDLDLEWHLIGHLQRNKAKRAAAAFPWIESVDSIELARKLDASAAEFGVQPRVLIEVNLGGEEAKTGMARADVSAIVNEMLGSRALVLSGLMIVPPIPTDAEESRPWFRQLRDLRDTLVADGVPADRLRELSMGMSHDFEIAIEEGATIVRIGTAIFGRRVPPSHV